MNTDASSASAGPSGEELVVLVVDDTPLLRVASSALIRSCGASPVTAENGYEAVAKVMAGHHDLVLMDLQMPVIDGAAAVRLIRLFEAATPGRRRTPVVAYTSVGAELARSTVLADGFDEVLVKPADRDAMLACLQRWCPAESAGTRRVEAVEAAVAAIGRALRISDVMETVLQLQRLSLTAEEWARMTAVVADAHERLFIDQQNAIVRSKALLARSRAALDRVAVSMAPPARAERRLPFGSGWRH